MIGNIKKRFLDIIKRNFLCHIFVFTAFKFRNKVGDFDTDNTFSFPSF